MSLLLLLSSGGEDGPTGTVYWVQLKVGAYSLTATTGAFEVAGNNATLGPPTRHLDLSTGAFEVTGNDATLSTPNKRIVVETGAFEVTGNNATLYTGASPLVAQTGAFEVTGNDATLRHGGVGTVYWVQLEQGARLVATNGSFKVTRYNAELTASEGVPILGTIYWAQLEPPGVDATITCLTGSFTARFAAAYRDYELTAQRGQFKVTRNSATLDSSASIKLFTTTGAFTLTGNDATLTKGAAYTLTATTGAFNVTGYDIGIITNPQRIVFFAGIGSFKVTGYDLITRRELLLSAETGDLEVSGKLAELIANSASAAILRAKSARAGSYVKRKKYSVTIDDEEFFVDSVEEAEALLATAVDAAQDKADRVVNEVTALKGKPRKRALATAKAELQPPEIEASSPLDSLVEAAQAQIKAAYEQAIQAAMLADIERRQIEQDDEDVLMLL